MWLRLRLDIGWRHLCWGALAALTPGRQARAQHRLEAQWSVGSDDALACLSVRSGFDLILQALSLPQGSEVLFSAITIPDMPSIARAHGLTPVPVDLAGSDFQVGCDALRAALSPRARVLVLAHLFGARPDTTMLVQVAHEHGLFVIEDCAQAWFDRRWRGNERADASLFSFGAIKTATALGGALCRVRDPAVLARARAIHAEYPVQGIGLVLSRLLKYSGLKLVSCHAVFGLIAKLARCRGRQVDELLQGLTRAFPGPDLLPLIRQRPHRGTLRLMRLRISHYDAGRIERRIRNARRIIERLGLQTAQPELLESPHTFWLLPLATAHPESLTQHLRSHGYDTTRRGSLAVLQPPDERETLACTGARNLLDHTVLLPCYPEMPLSAVTKMCEIISAHQLR